MTTLLEVADLSVRYAGTTVLDAVSFPVDAGTVVGLIGPNGAGKTTLLDVLSGFVTPNGGRVFLDGVPLLDRRPHERARLGVGRTFQSKELFDDLGVGDNLRIAAEGAGVPLAEVDAVAARVHLDARDPRPVVALPTGDRAALALGRALASRPRLLLLDEPAAGLDPEARRRLAQLLRQAAASGAGVLLVDHDLSLVLEVCDRVVVLDLGRVVADGPPDRIRADPTVAEVYVGRTPADSPPRGAPARARDDRVTETVVHARALSAGYGAGHVVSDVDLDVVAGEVVALLGPNGAGKTTTLLALSGVLRDVAGEVQVLGRPVRPGHPRGSDNGVAHVLQNRRVFTELTARDNLRLVDRSRRGVESAVRRFPALAPVLDRRAGSLSGGEQQMLALARAFMTQPRLLVVDELSLGLAPRIVAELLAQVRAAADDVGTAVLLAEQHAQLALGVADRAYVLAAGRVTDSGDAAALAADPDRLLRAYLGTASP